MSKIAILNSVKDSKGGKENGMIYVKFMYKIQGEARKRDLRERRYYYSITLVTCDAGGVTVWRNKEIKNFIKLKLES